MTDLVSFYTAVAADMANVNPSYSFDQITGKGWLGAEDYLVKQQSYNDLQSVSLYGSEVLDMARFWYNEAVVIMPQRDIRAELSRRFAAVLAAAFSAKKDLTGGQIALGKQGNVIPQLLRPATVLSTSSTLVETWVPAANPAKGWTSSYFTINLNLNSTGGNAAKLQNLCTGLILGLGDWAAAPILREAQVLDPTGAKYGIYSFPYTKMFDETALYLFAEAYYMKLNEQWTIDVNFDSNSAAVPVVFGAQFARNTLATSE